MASASRAEIVILGGGFGGVFTARSLERRLRGMPGARITLISQNNFHLMTPLLFETASGAIEARSAVTPIRNLLRRTRFLEATVEHVDLDRRTVHARQLTSQESLDVPYDHLVLALGAITERRRIPGSEEAFTFKTLGDALTIRSRIIERFEQAALEKDPRRRQALLTFVVIGGGLVGVEFTGELTAFLSQMCRWYDVAGRDIRFHLIEAGPHLLPEMHPDIARYVQGILEARGVQLHVHVPVEAIEAERVRLGGDQVIESHTILLAAGLGPNPVIAELPVAKDRHQRVLTTATMQVRDRRGVWALGDCAHIPDPHGQPYPQLAQHALREARMLARNIKAAITGRALRPFRYHALGTLAMVGGFQGVGLVLGRQVKGIAAWALWRLYYAYRMPSLDRKIRLLVDWALALFFKPDVSEVDVVAKSADVSPPELPLPRTAQTPAVLMH